MIKIILTLLLTLGLLTANIAYAAETTTQEKAKQEAKAQRNSLKQENQNKTDKKTTSKIDLNKASKEELKSIKGIGDVLADSIIKARPFKSWDDVGKVKGIGDAKLKAIKQEAKI